VPFKMKVVLEDDFMVVFHSMMCEAEKRGTRWYHPKMGLFQVIGWEEK
ncbi:ORF6N domain-containing protein, partial [Providencia stuartii]